MSRRTWQTVIPAITVARFVHNPKLAKVMGPLGAYFRTGYSLSEREREIAVCIINSKWRSIYPDQRPRARR